MRWYEARQPGLGVEFVGVVDEALQRIVSRPEALPLWRPDRLYRKCLVRRFPYIVFFEYSGDTVTVVAIAHRRRQPEYWLNR